MNEFTNKPGIYLLRNKINNKIYIGKSKNIKDRIKRHKYSENSNPNRKPLILRAIKKYGWVNFEVIILGIFDYIDNDILLDVESFWIKKLNATNRNIGYNFVEYSSDWTGKHHSEETKKKISNLAKERYKNKSGPNFGKKMLEETKEKLRKKALLRNVKLENNPFYGKHHTPETKEKLREANKELINTFKKSVEQIDISTGKVIKVWESMREANFFFTGKRNSSRISAICNEKPNKKGYIPKSAFGFKWRFYKKINENDLSGIQ